MKILLFSLILIPIVSGTLAMFIVRKSEKRIKASRLTHKEDSLAKKNRDYYEALKMNEDGFYSGTKSPIHGHSGGRTTRKSDNPLVRH